MNIKILNFNFNKDTLKSEIESQNESVVLVLDINYSDLSLLENHKTPFSAIDEKFEKYNYLLSLQSDTCEVQETEEFKKHIKFLKVFQKFNDKYLDGINPLDSNFLCESSAYKSKSFVEDRFFDDF
jgi:hypothetical protein